MMQVYLSLCENIETLAAVCIIERFYAPQLHILL